MKITVGIDAYNQFEVTIPLSPAAAFLAYTRLASSKRLSMFDGEDPLEFERGLGGWMCYHDNERPSLAGVSVVIDEEGSRLVIHGEVSPEGDDRLDGAFEAHELSLTDRLAVASLVREVLL